MDDLSKYIKKELSTILSHAKITTPKKSYSMSKIKTMVNSSPLKEKDKKDINKSIQKIESVIQLKTLTSKQKKNPKLILSVTNNPYKRQLFYQKMLLDEMALTNKKVKNNKGNIQHNPGFKNLIIQKCRKIDDRARSKSSIQNQDFNYLINRYQQLKTIRLQRQNHLSQLMIKAQRLNRLLDIKKENNQKYLTSKKLSEDYQQKNKVMNKIQRDIKTAASKSNRKTVHSLMEKYQSYLN